MLRKLNFYMAKVSIFLITPVLIVGMGGCVYTSPPSQNLEIRTWYNLDAVRDNLSGHHILMNDLDSTIPGYEELASPTAHQGRGWDPIGIYLDLGECPFKGFIGTFDGQGYEIRDLFINRPDEGWIGLFGALDRGWEGCWDGEGEGRGGGVIRDIGAVNVTVTGYEYIGGLVGFNSGTVSNSYFTGNVSGDESVGGLVGLNSGTVSNSCFTGSVSGNERVGGLVGANWPGTVSNSYYNYDDVLINGENVITIGALFGEDFEEWLANDKFLDVNERLSQKTGYYVINNISDFKQLLAFGQNDTLKFRLTNDLDLVDELNFYIPYFAGEFDGNGHKISNLSCDFGFVSYVGLFGYIAHGGKVTEIGIENVSITGASSWVGGLVGFNDGAVRSSYSSGSVSGNMYVGGLMGVNWDSDTVSNSYSTGNVTGTWGVGGLMGANWGGTVSKSYSTGSVTGDKHIGGLAGENMGGGQISNSFWDTETSGQTTSAGGKGKTTAQMKDIATFSGAEWKIIAVALGKTNSARIWNIVDDETYPFLSWQL